MMLFRSVPHSFPPVHPASVSIVRPSSFIVSKTPLYHPPYRFHPSELFPFRNGTKNP